MKIKTSSWHYRMINAFDFEYRNTVCGYFCALLKALVSVIIIAFMVVVVGFLLLSPMLYMAACIKTGWFYDIRADFPIMAGSLMWIIVIMFVLELSGFYDYIERIMCSRIEIDYE